jgi:hypothetical protein
MANYEKGSIMNNDQKEKAQHLLEDPELLNILVAEVQKNVTGETSTIKTILICSSGRLVKNSKESSHNLIIHAESGAGKDHVVSKTLGIYPDGVVESRKTISPKTFTYWHNALVEPDWTWEGKIFYGEDVPNRVLNDEVFKIMASSGNRTSTIVIKNKAIDIKVNGKPVMIITTASADLSRENLRRFAVCPMDETQKQTRRIKKMLSEEARRGISDIEPDIYIKTAMGKLQRIEVKIPYARKLERLLPDNLIIRTAYGRFLDYIKASAALYQYQRKHKKAGVVSATWADYDIAREAILKTTSSRTMIPMSGIDKDIWWLMEKTEPDLPNGWFSTDFIYTKSSYEYRAVIRHLNNMYKNELLEKEPGKSAVGRPPFVWKPKRADNLTLPKSKEL